MKKKVDFEFVSVDSLIPYDRNARKHSAEQVAKVAASIKEFGFLAPIVVDKNNVLVAGHCRLLAAKKLGMDKVPVVKASHLTDAQRRAYTLADNKLGLESSWDDALLKIEIETLRDLDFDISLTGFELDDIEGLGEDDEVITGSKQIEGSKELNENSFSEFECKCPRCGFEFDKKE
jgi:ParB-like chromosome segregation protein Spo0J